MNHPIGLIPVDEEPRAAHLLFDWLLERNDDRNVNISHVKPVSWKDHIKFMRSDCYRHWYLARANDDGRYVGQVYATHLNEVGIILARAERGKGLGPIIMRRFLELHQPLPALPGKRRGVWLANINPANERSIKMFEKLGFRHVQNTYALQEE